MALDQELRPGQNPADEQSLAHILLIELLAFVQHLREPSCSHDAD